ncbi:hypothetical protein [Croceitalea rosinachiae]|uniref:Uncharacterized protein n=1 Tax=Croceitalea rosinachiae TaxID=3075596 RepID=A0ABU3A7D2_9FLAO|nr:hypothetical protein [Croceitalea sp. F388]MDT0606066.1 hypothetical protein [Croceitalea sp. F388]
MSKTFIIVLVAIALALAIYNITLLDFNNLFEGDSLIACIGVLASLCAIVILLIFNTSRKISEKLKN